MKTFDLRIFSTCLGVVSIAAIAITSIYLKAEGWDLVASASITGITALLVAKEVKNGGNGNSGTVAPVQ